MGNRAMRQVRIHDFGGPDRLRLDTVPTPEPRDDEVLVHVAAASINPVDNKIRASGGRFKTAADLPVPMGRDVAGTIAALGPRARDGLAVGQRVFAMVGFDRGAFADAVVVKPAELAIPPETLSDAQAAAVPLAALTAWQGLVDHGGLRNGQRVLVHGGSGGVGHFAVQIARALGARVAATASAGSRAFLRDIGADPAIDRDGERFEDAGPFDLVLDLVGGDTATRSFAALAEGGLVVSTLATPDRPADAPPGTRATDFVVEPRGGDLQRIADLIADGRLRPHVHARYPLDRIAAAAGALAAGGVKGKIVIDVAAAPA